MIPMHNKQSYKDYSDEKIKNELKNFLLLLEGLCILAQEAQI